MTPRAAEHDVNRLKNFEDGALVSEFVEWFLGVTLEQVRAMLEHAARSALAPA